MGNGQISLESIVVISEDAVFRDLEGKEVILNLESGDLFGLNEVGTRIWTLIQEHASLLRVFGALQGRYNASPDVIKADLLQLVQQLYDKGLVRVTPNEERHQTGA